MDSSLNGLEPAFKLSERSDNTGRGETMSAIQDWALLIIDLFKSSAEKYEKKVFELLTVRPLK